MPFLVVDHLPVLNAILPSRVALEMDACLAAVIAFGLDDIRRVPGRSSNRRRRRSAVYAGVTLVALVLTQLPRWPMPSTAPSALALPTALTRAMPKGDPVAITYPYDVGTTGTLNLNQPMLWQAEDDFAFRLLGGYAWHVSPEGNASLLPDLMSPRGTQQLLANEEGVNLLGSETPVSPKLVAATRSVMSRYDVRVVIVDRSVPGSGAVMELFRDALGRPLLSAGRFSMWANWHGRPSREQFSHDLSTRVLRPTNDAKLSGTAVLDAQGAGYYPVTKVEFLLSGEGHHGEVIAQGFPTLYGSIARWNTTSVANGRYSLQSKAYDAFGASSLSTMITITVDNN
jgi:hypothetical protein